MKKVFKWLGIGFGILIMLVIVFAGAMFFIGSSKLAKNYEVQPDAIVIPEDKQSIERGAYLYEASCAGCHGDDLSGKAILEDPVIGYLTAPNLTTGQGGIGNNYSDTDYVRAIRHGVDPEGQGLLIMPAKAYWHFSEDDLAAIIAYVKAVIPVDNDPGEKSLSPLGKIMLATGAFGKAIAAEVLDHDAPLPVAPDRGATAAHGEYMINTRDCAACHGSDLAGEQSPEPGSPFSSNLTPGGVLAIWTAEDFIETMRTVITPYGRQLDLNFMPYEEYGRLTDEDLTAMFWTNLFAGLFSAISLGARLWDFESEKSAEYLQAEAAYGTSLLRIYPNSGRVSLNLPHTEIGRPTPISTVRWAAPPGSNSLVACQNLSIIWLMPSLIQIHQDNSLQS